ncbi:hypothetical protein MSTE_03554 [Mycobacteroides stephanolepidis]|uniref:Uncharacterized protein n=1 Tax=[Mycobacterium] stephanolepidis TaxID=1520670 RepID=A0A1Z4F0Z5_9MYCO|nr:hypothetical protein MSTE_03554 [[Mycobacterium] stephanolepidis]
MNPRRPGYRWRRLRSRPLLRLWDNQFQYITRIETPLYVEPWPTWLRRIVRHALHLR